MPVRSRGPQVRFQLVQRSLRDPLRGDPDASPLVLVPMPPSRNQRRRERRSAASTSAFPDAGTALEDVLQDLPNDVVAQPGCYTNEEDFVPNVDETHREHDFADDLEEYRLLQAQLTASDVADAAELQNTGFQFDPREMADFQSKLQTLREKYGNITQKHALEYPEDTPNLANDPASYGVFFDDADEYDYMSHLKPIAEDDPTAVFIGAANTTPTPKKESIIFTDPKDSSVSQSVDLPDDVLPSKTMISLDAFHNPQTVESPFDVPAEVREVLYALDDDEFLDEDLDDDFFENLNAEEVDPELERRLNEETAQYEAALREKGRKENTIFQEEWHKDFVKFKEEQDKLEAILSDDDLDGVDECSDAESVNSKFSVGDAGSVDLQELDEDELAELLDQLGPLGSSSRSMAHTTLDEIPTLVDNNGDPIEKSDEEPKTTRSLPRRPEPRVLPRPSATGTVVSVGGSRYRPMRRHTAASAVSSALSMSSSALFRNENLTNLDDRFDRVLGEYDDTVVGGLESDDDDVRGDNAIKKEQMESMLDEYMDNSFLRGRNNTVIEAAEEDYSAIDHVRNELGGAMKKIIERYDAIEEDEEGEAQLAKQEKEELEATIPEEKVYDNWDVQTVLSNYSNIYNRPKIVTVNSCKPGNLAHIKVKNTRSGIPIIQEINKDGSIVSYSAGPTQTKYQGEDDESSDENEAPKINKGVARTKHESKDEKKLRKQLVKEEKRNRRVDKKINKEFYNNVQK